MRVLHWFPNYFSGGGVANAVTALAHAQANAGAAVSIAGVATEREPLYGPHEEHPGVTLFRWAVASQRALGDLVLRRPAPEAAAELRAWAPDVVHLHAEFSPDNLWAARIFACPLILSFHGALHPEVFRKSKQLRKHLYLQFARRSLYAKMAGFHALSPAEAGQIRNVVPGRPINTIPLGGVRRDQAQDGKRAPGTNVSDGLDLVFLGRLDVYTKGLDILLEAFATAQADLRRELRLTFIGPDWRGGRGQLYRRAQALGIADRVIFTGAVPSTEVQTRLAAADIYAQLSRNDAFPLSLVEALIVGTPALISQAVDSTSYTEISSLSHIRMVPPTVSAARQALTDLVNNHELIADQARSSQAQVADFFSWTRIAKLHLDAYSVHLVGARAS